MFLSHCRTAVDDHVSAPNKQAASTTPGFYCRRLPRTWRVVGIVFTLSAIAMGAAQTDIGWRQIEEFGCHLDGVDVCFVRVSGSAFGPQSCQGIELRWHLHEVPNGEAWLALVTSAHLAGADVRFWVSNNCFEQNPGVASQWPTFRWGRVRAR